MEFANLASFKPMIYNQSMYSTPLLRKMIKLANFTVRCKGPVVFKITKGSKYGASGLATKSSCNFIFEKTITKKKSDLLIHQQKKIPTTCGWIILRPPINPEYKDFAFHSIIFFNTIIHELKHVYDWQTDNVFNCEWSSSLTKSGYLRQKKQKWETRPQEIRAQEQIKNSMQIFDENPHCKKAYKTFIFNFALEMRKLNELKTLNKRTQV